MKQITLILSLLFVATFHSCGVDDAVDELTDDVICEKDGLALDALSEKATLAATAYANAPTEITCSAYKTSILDWVEGAKDYIDCLNEPQEKETLEALEESYQSILSNLDCE